jgi:hypothetical protein
MSKTYRIASILMIFLMSTLLAKTSVKAQTAGLSISPPVVEMLLSPSKKVVQTFTIKNQGESVNITATLHTVTPIGEDGHVSVNPTPLNPASIPLVASLTPSRFGEEMLLARDASEPLTLTFEGASVDAPIDTYLALVVRASPLTFSGESHTGATATSPAIAGLIFITLTPSGVIPTNLEITSFDPPLLHDTSTPFTLRPMVKNGASIMIRPTLQVSIASSQGKTVYEPETAKNLLLKESEREFGPLTWSPRWSNLGPHRIRLTLTTEGGTKVTEVEKQVWFLPIRTMVASILLLLIVGVMLIKRKRRHVTTLLMLCLVSLTMPPHTYASLTNVSDTLSTSMLSTSEAPVKVRHTITFTPSKVVPNGYFRILLPAATNGSNDGTPDEQGYDFNGGVSIEVADVPGYIFSGEAALASGDPECLVPTPYHCFKIPYSGPGGLEPIKVILGQADGTSSLLAPTKSSSNAQGVADLETVVIRHYDSSNTMLDYTSGHIGHLESVQVTARVKGTPQPDSVNVISIPFLPARVSTTITRYSFAIPIIITLAIIGLILLFLLIIRRKNILIIDKETQKPIEYFVLYHSLPELRRPGSPIWLARHEPLSYQVTRHNHGKLYIRSLGRYSTLTVRIKETTHILSISRKARFYTIPL